jgi:hypothetical protein
MKKSFSGAIANRQIILGLLRLKTEFIAGQPQAYRQNKEEKKNGNYGGT